MPVSGLVLVRVARPNKSYTWNRGGGWLGQPGVKRLESLCHAQAEGIRKRKPARSDILDARRKRPSDCHVGRPESRHRLRSEGTRQPDGGLLGGAAAACEPRADARGCVLRAALTKRFSPARNTQPRTQHPSPARNTQIRAQRSAPRATFSPAQHSAPHVSAGFPVSASRQLGTDMIDIVGRVAG